MKYVDSGNGKIPLISLIAFLSISLTVNLPGLAISPIMGKLDQVFSHVTQLEIQLLTVLPNIVTIPFILCSGKICTQKNQMKILAIGLALYTLTGVLYFFATTMTELILLSCLLGVGCGLVIPLAASLISQHFTGRERTRQLGMKSSLSNFTVIIGTLFVGWVAAIDWHLAFLVYLIPLIPLCLIPFMTGKFIKSHTEAETDDDASAPTAAPAMERPAFSSARRMLTVLAGIMVLYGVMTYAVEVVAYYLPFTMGHWKFTSAQVGVATAMFYASATVAGFFLTRILRLLGRATMTIALLICSCGLFMCGLLHQEWSYIAGIFIMGLGYGVIQPVIYDKTSELAPTPAKSTAYFSYLLTCNYVGISLVPFIVSGARRLFEAQGNPDFSFLLNGAIVAAVLAIAVVMRRSYVFSTSAPAGK